MSQINDRAAVRRLLDRFGFGPRPGEVDSAAAKGFDATLSWLLDAAAPAADAGARATPPPDLGPEPYQPGGKKDKAAMQAAAAALSQQIVQITEWWLERMVAAEAPLAERLTWFWHGHFATSVQKVRSARLMLAQNEALRRLGGGDFRELAKAMVLDPAMLIWLDGQQNRVGAANENLARELMELFTLGVGHYSEADVREAARALTGWKVDRVQVSAAPVAKEHDAGAKTVLGMTGPLDANSLVDMLVVRGDSARFVASRLWFRLVSGSPPSAEALDRLAVAYGPGRDVRALLKAIAVEPGFRDSGTALVKQPVEWVVGLMRALRLRPSQLHDKERTALLGGLRGLGQTPFAPPSVGGWPAGNAWLTTSAGLARLQIAQLLANHADLGAVAGSAAASRVEAVGLLLAVDQWSDRTRAALGKVTGDPKQLVTAAACAPEYVVSG